MMADERKYDDLSDYKRSVIEELLRRHVNLSDEQIGEVFGVDEVTVGQVRQYLHRSTIDSMDTPLTWDYVLAFKVGSDEEKVKPKKRDLANRTDNEDENEWKDGMSQKKYYGQIFRDFWRRLENARLNVRAYRSSDEQLMFLIVGITEANLKLTADDRDTDLLLDPKGAVLAGREKHFPLAQRTMVDPQNDDPNKCDIDISNWDNMYCQYNPRADTQIYQKYPRFNKSYCELLESQGKKVPQTIFDEKTRLRIIYESIIADDAEGGAEIKIDDFLFNKKHPLCAVFPLHDSDSLDEFDLIWRKKYFDIKTWLWCPLQKVRSYFGEPVGFYFAFLQFYMRWLLFPAAIGIIFFIIQLALEKIDAPGVFLMSFFIIFWSVAFVDFWAREESRLRLQWGMTKFEQKAVARPQFHGDWKHDPVTGLWSEQFSFLQRGFRMSLIFSGVSLFLLGCVTLVVFVLLLRDGSPNDFQLKIGLGVVNGVMIFIFDVIYKKVSGYGNEWENHRTQQDYENAYIQKSFFFKFFNSFSSLFYLGFVRPSVSGDNYYMRFYPYINEENSCECGDEYVAAYYCYSKSASNTTTSVYNFDGENCYEDGSKVKLSKIGNSWWSICTDDYGPDSNDNYIEAPCNESKVQLLINETVMGELRIQLATLFLTAIFVQNSLEVLIPFLVDFIKDRTREKKQMESGGEVLERSEPEEQMDFGQYKNTIDDMSEIIIQYGYVTLFVMALPITPLLALINNIFEMRVDAYGLIRQTQRPHPNGSNGLGAWNGILGFFSIVAVGTNVALLTWRTEIVQDINDVFSSDSSASEFKWIFFSILSIVLALVVAFEKWIIPDVPIEVEYAIERQRLIESVLVLGAQIDPDNDTPPEDDDGEFDFNPKYETIDSNSLKLIPSKNLRLGGIDTPSNDQSHEIEMQNDNNDENDGTDAGRTGTTDA